jgi:hypothetical protein
MKNILTLLFLFLTIFLFSQETLIIEAKQANDSDYFDYEDYETPDKPIGELIFLKGCSWYCGGDVKLISASSELKGSKKISYAPSNAHDFNKNTAWVEGNPDYGIGEFIEYCFDFREVEDYKGTLGINKILLANGYKKSKQAWENNSRVKQLKMYVNNKSFAILNLLDVFEIQTITIPEIKFSADGITKIKFEITKVYKGKKHKDTAISLLMFEGVGVH